MERQWYCKVAGQKYGPISWSVLQEWIRTKRVSRTDVVRNDDSEWVVLGTLQGIDWPVDHVPSPPVVHPVGARPIIALCPHCRAELHIQPHYAGVAVSCPHCNGRFQAPMPQASLAFSTSGSSRHVARLHTGIKICVLISGIGNIVIGLFWISTLLGIVIGIPQIILALFEIIFFAQADSKPLDDALRQGKLLGILEIISGCFNLVSLVCGILVLAFAASQRS